MKMPEVTIIDYGVGNLLSVKRSLEHCGAKVFLSADPNVILTSQRVVLPGVGAFPNAMDALNKLKLGNFLDEILSLKKKGKKYKFIEKTSSIFIDDSFSERLEVSNKLNIPVFSPQSFINL